MNIPTVTARAAKRRRVGGGYAKCTTTWRWGAAEVRHSLFRVYYRWGADDADAEAADVELTAVRHG